MKRMPRPSALAGLCALALSIVLVPADSSAFPHTMQPGETLAQLAIAMYGSARFEPILVGANGLDSHGSATVPTSTDESNPLGYISSAEGTNAQSHWCSPSSARSRSSSSAIARPPRY